MLRLRLLHARAVLSQFQGDLETATSIYDRLSRSTAGSGTPDGNGTLRSILPKPNTQLGLTGGPQIAWRRDGETPSRSKPSRLCRRADEPRGLLRCVRRGRQASEAAREAIREYARANPTPFTSPGLPNNSRWRLPGEPISGGPRCSTAIWAVYRATATSASLPNRRPTTGRVRSCANVSPRRNSRGSPARVRR